MKFLPPLALALWCVLPAQARTPELAQTDGPYVMRRADGRLESWSIANTAEGPRKRVAALESGATLTVPAVGSVPPLTVKLRAPAEKAANIVKTRADAPLFVVADTHGEYEILVGMLSRNGVIDARLRWNFGSGFLVILGDVFDRGAHHTEILWLIYSLEAQARKAGGGVVFVLGNHEFMVLGGDLRYLHPKYVQTTQLLGASAYSQLFDATSVLGQWLRARSTVVQVNDFLCVHGGVSREIVDRKLTLPVINDSLRAVLAGVPPSDDAARERAGFLLGSQGPIWYRGYFSGAPDGIEASAEDVGMIRKSFGVNRILVGHTRVPSITPLFKGAVIAVQVYPQRHDDGTVEFEALLIRDGQFFRARPDGSREPLAF